MARKLSKTQQREQARQAYEARMREQQYSIIKVEGAKGWGFVVDAVPNIIIHYALCIEGYSMLACAFERETAQDWADRIAQAQNVETTVIPVEEGWERLRHSHNLVAMAQRYV